MKNTGLTYIPFLLLFLGTFLHAQSTIEIPSEDFEIDLPSRLEYFHDVNKSKTIETVQNKKFVPYKNKNFPGLLKQKFWFRVSLEKETNSLEDLFFKIRAYSYIRYVHIYEVRDGTAKKIYTHNTLRDRKFQTQFVLQKSATYYFEVQFSWTVLFKAKLLSLSKNQSNLITDSSFQGLYYGFSLLILLLNLFFFFFTKNKFFVYYVVFQFGILASIAFLDNYIFDLFDNSSFTKYFEIIYSSLISLGSVLFVDSALDMKRHFRYFKTIGLSLLTLALVIFGLRIIGLENTQLVNTINLLILVFCYLTSIYFCKHLIYARFVICGLSVLFICHVLYILPVIYGYKDLGFYEWHYKIGSIIEMLIFMAAIPYRHKILASEKITLEENYTQQEKKYQEELKKLNSQNINPDDKLDLFSKKYNLKSREQQVLQIMTKGATNKEISEQLHISLDTVKHYCSRMYEKTEVQNRTQLIVLFNDSTF